MVSLQEHVAICWENWGSSLFADYHKRLEFIVNTSLIAVTAVMIKHAYHFEIRALFYLPPEEHARKTTQIRGYYISARYFLNDCFKLQLTVKTVKAS